MAPKMKDQQALRPNEATTRYTTPKMENNRRRDPTIGSTTPNMDASDALTPASKTPKTAPKTEVTTLQQTTVQYTAPKTVKLPARWS